MIEIYKKYFEDIAIAKLGHVDKNDASFFYVKDKYNPKAFDDAIKSVAKTPALLLEPYTTNFDDNNNENFFRYLNGRFTVLLKAEHGNQDSIDAAHAKAEKICERLVLYMRNDLSFFKILSDDAGNSSKVSFKIKNIPVDQVGPIASTYYGATTGFIWKCPLSVAEVDGDWLT